MKSLNIEPKLIKINERQRKTVDLTGLKDSIAKYGILNPLLIDKENNLIAGERRLACAFALGLKTVPVRQMSSLSEIDSKILELEENVHRQDLPWRDLVSAVGNIHKIFSSEKQNWSISKTSEVCGFTPEHTSKLLRVFKHITDKKLADATSMIAAYNILVRMEERKREAMEVEVDRVMSSILTLPTAIIEKRLNTAADIAANIPEPLQTVLCDDFNLFAPAYKDEPFNLIHCDFPYGKNIFKGPQMQGSTPQQYVDTSSILLELINSLVNNRKKLLAQSAHIIFWVSPDKINLLLRLFQEKVPEWVPSSFPIVWLKSDNVGISSDPRRVLRHIYESALVFTIGDRPLVKTCSDAYAAQTNNTYHPSAKPEPMLRYFLSAFVDSTTRFLDPTCGAGSSMLAAESLGCAFALGLEKSPEYADVAKTLLCKARLLRKASLRSKTNHAS